MFCFIISTVLAALCLSSVPVTAHPILEFYYHGPPKWSESKSAPEFGLPTASPSFSTFSVQSHHVSASKVIPHGFTASGFAPFPTGVTGVTGASGHVYPTATGSSFPAITLSLHGHGHHQNVTANATASATSNATAIVTANAVVSAAAAPLPSVIRGVNLGGWLVLEKWMNTDMFDGTDAVDEWTFDLTDGAEAKLKSHWDTYITEADMQQIASWGINAVRIPIGYWAYNNTGTPYITGADYYLERAIGWARTAGLQVLVDCHGSPGSQNGFDNSGREGNVSWQTGDNLNVSIAVLETMTKKYGTPDYADVVFAIELVNEPISWNQNNFGTTKQWAQEAYTAVKAAATNPDLMVFMHDGFMGPSNWETVGDTINGDATLEEAKFAVDVHLYQNQVAADSLLTQAQHITMACNYTTSELLPSSATLPVFVGEFSAATNICANPDGTTVAGDTCTESGCQCSSNVPIESWNTPLVQATRKFLEAELDAFEHSARGWFMWTYKGPGAWGLANAVQYGLIGEKVTDRMFPGQCDSLWSSS